MGLYWIKGVYEEPGIIVVVEKFMESLSRVIPYLLRLDSTIGSIQFEA